MTVTHPHLLEKAILAETSHADRVLMVQYAGLWGVDCADTAFGYEQKRIRADYKRRVQKKGRKIAA